MKSPARRRITKISIIVAVAVFFGTFVYKDRVADEPERRCGITNLFRWDYSGELAAGVRFSVDKSDVQVDFTSLKGWKRICLVSMYEESFYGLADEFPWNDPSFHQIGRWQCSAGNPDDAITVALIKADGATLARQLKFPEGIRPRITSTYYEGGPGMEMILADTASARISKGRLLAALGLPPAIRGAATCCSRQASEGSRAWWRFLLAQSRCGLRSKFWLVYA